jgi:hypothetical protein
MQNPTFGQTISTIAEFVSIATTAFRNSFRQLLEIAQTVLPNPMLAPNFIADFKIQL